MTEKFSSPKLLLLLTILCIVFIAVTIYFEYKARQDDYIRLLEKQAALFINTVRNATQNALAASNEIDEELDNRILSILKLINQSNGPVELSDALIDDLFDKAGVEALFVYDERGRIVRQWNVRSDEAISPPPIGSLLADAVDDTVLTVFDSNNLDAYRTIAFTRRENGGAIAAFINQDDKKNIQQKLGIGYFFQRLQAEENIEYVVVQNLRIIIAGSFTGYDMPPFSSDPVLQGILDSEQTVSRILKFDRRLVYETLSPFYLDDVPFGVLRLGLSMEEYQGLRRDIRERLFILAAVLIVFGLIFINLLVSYRHRRLLRRDLGRLQHYTTLVFDNLSSGVMSVDQHGKIRSANKRALEFAGCDLDSALNKRYTVLPKAFQDAINDHITSGEPAPRIIKNWITSDAGERRLFTLQTNLLDDESDTKSCVLIINDVTDQSFLEEQIQRNQRLSAMRNLAFSVAHEIKNPLNAISLLIDLIRKKYKPIDDKDGVVKHLDTVSAEIRRMSDIIQQYLRFSRPPALKKSAVVLSELMDEVISLLGPQLSETKIDIKVEMAAHSALQVDADQLKQLFINLLKNAGEAIGEDGKILINGQNVGSSYEIRITDNGKGIAEKDMDAIFDLHFTTKSKGSGIGLSIVQQIVAAHSGTIDVESQEGRGTTFFVRFPFEKE